MIATHQPPGQSRVQYHMPGILKELAVLKYVWSHMSQIKKKKKKKKGGGGEQKIEEEKEYFRPLQNAPVDFMLKLESDFRKRRTAGSNAKTPRSVTA